MSPRSNCVGRIQSDIKVSARIVIGSTGPRPRRARSRGCSKRGRESTRAAPARRPSRPRPIRRNKAPARSAPNSAISGPEKPKRAAPRRHSQRQRSDGRRAGTGRAERTRGLEIPGGLLPPSLWRGHTLDLPFPCACRETRASSPRELMPRRAATPAKLQALDVVHEQRLALVGRQLTAPGDSVMMGERAKIVVGGSPVYGSRRQPSWISAGGRILRPAHQIDMARDRERPRPDRPPGS